jgi:hypothetical protein
MARETPFFIALPVNLEGSSPQCSAIRSLAAQVRAGLDEDAVTREAIRFLDFVAEGKGEEAGVTDWQDKMDALAADRLQEMRDKAEREDSPLRRAIVTAWALYEGYKVEATVWWPECECIEAWNWEGPDGEELGGEMGDHDEPPALPDDLFARLNSECRWDQSVLEKPSAEVRKILDELAILDVSFRSKVVKPREQHHERLALLWAAHDAIRAVIRYDGASA